MGQNNEELPCDIQAESVILGSIFLDNESFYDETADLKTEDFYLDSHRRIYACLNDILFGMVEGIKQADIVTVSNELTKRGDIGLVGGTAYLASLTDGLPIHPVVGEYVKILKDKSRLRRIMLVCGAGYNRAADRSAESGTVLTDIETQLLAISTEGEDHCRDIGEIAPTVEARVKTKQKISDERKALELTWGLAGLDDFTHGMFRGEFTVLGGESSGGKTALAIQIMLENAKEGTKCGFFSMEMTKEQIVSRCYPQLSEILTANHMRDPRLMNLHHHMKEVERLTQEFNKLPIKIDDSSPMRIDVLLARMRMMRQKYGITLFIGDYLQLVEGMPGLQETTAFKKIVFALRDFPKDNPDCHLLMLSQYSQAEKFTRKPKRSKDSLYGGSVIHHAAQNILMVTIEDPEKRDKLDLLDVELRFAKQRDGRRGKEVCQFDRDHLKFCYAERRII